MALKKQKHEHTSDFENTLNGIKPPKDSVLGQKLTQVYSPNRDTWIRSYKLVSSWEIHKDCIEPFIWHGYRPNPSSVSYCLKSAFYPSNETFNAWTHFIPFLFMVWRTFNVLFSFQNPYEQIIYPFWIQSFGSCAMLLTSSFAHLFCCHSAAGQEVCYCLDYGMIPVYGLTTAVAIEHYICPFRCYGFLTDILPEAFYLKMVLFLSVFGTYIWYDLSLSQ